MICGAEACNLGAMIHGAELRVHFLKSFQKESTCENLSPKGLKSRKDGITRFQIYHDKIWPGSWELDIWD
jgi:hypothetical protein